MAGAPQRRFSYRGRFYTARVDETLLATLARRGLPTLARSNRYHRPRAPFCGVGQCTGCLVRVNDRPAVRACRYLPGEGDTVESERGWPSPRFDVLGILDYLFPHGIDTLRGFRWPAFASPLYHRLVRRLSGYGEPPREAAPSGPEPPPVSRSVDVVVVGGGRTGKAVADRLLAGGLRPLLIDRSLRKETMPVEDGIVGASVTFLPPPKVGRPYPFTLLGFTEAGQGLEMRSRTVVVATGGYDASLLFGGNDRPGVLTADAALALYGSGRPPLFRRAVLVGGGPRARELLDRCGPDVSAVAAPGEIGPEVVRLASDYGIPLYPRSLLLRTTGRSRVRALHLRSRGGEVAFSLACDAVVLAHRRLPNAQLLFQAGARMEWRDGAGAYYPVLDTAGATSVPGLYAVGEVAGVPDAARDASATRVADTIAGRATPDPEPPVEGALRGPNELSGYYRELFRSPRRGRWIACVCEDVLVEEVEEAVRAGFRGIEVVKRYSNLGTGLCQGRYCLPDALLLLSILEGRPPSELGYVTQRPPVFPTPLSALAALSETAPTEAAS